MSDLTAPGGPAPDLAGDRSYPGTLLVGCALTGVVVLLALVSFVWTPYDPGLIDGLHRLQGPSGEHLLGTDKFGRDELSRIMVGARTTVFVGVVAVGLSVLVGVPLGILGAMGPRWLGELVGRLGDLVLAFPALLLAYFFAFFFRITRLQVDGFCNQFFHVFYSNGYFLGIMSQAIR